MDDNANNASANTPETTPPVDDGSGAIGERQGKIARPRNILIALTVIGAIAALSLGGLAMTWGDEEPAGMTLVIPEGAAATLDYPTLDSAIDVPTSLVFEQGQVLTIRNEDVVANRAGPWVLASGESLRLKFDTPGEYFYLCTVDEAKSVTVTVVEELEGTPGVATPDTL